MRNIEIDVTFLTMEFKAVLIAIVVFFSSINGAVKGHGLTVSIGAITYCSAQSETEESVQATQQEQGSKETKKSDDKPIEDSGLKSKRKSRRDSKEQKREQQFQNIEVDTD